MIRTLLAAALLVLFGVTAEASCPTLTPDQVDITKGCIGSTPVSSLPDNSLIYKTGGIFIGLSIGNNLSVSGTTLNAAGGTGLPGGSSGDVQKNNGSGGFGAIAQSRFAFLDTPDQTVTGGANVTAQSQPTGNITIDCGERPAQYTSNVGAFTITAPSLDGYCYLDVENGVGAGPVVVSGFTPNSIGGAALDVTNGNNFRLYISRVHGHATIDAKALQ